MFDCFCYHVDIWERLADVRMGTRGEKIPHGNQVQILGAWPPSRRILNSALVHCESFHRTNTATRATPMVLGEVCSKISSIITANRSFTRFFEVVEGNPSRQSGNLQGARTGFMYPSPRVG